MKVLILSRYDRQGASSRLRTMQYLPYLAELGLEAQVESFFGSDYLQQMYAGHRSPVAVGKRFIRRIHRMQQEADLIWLEKEALPWVPWAVERLCWPGNTPVVSDYDDAIYHRYDQSPRTLTRSLLGSKIDQVMRASALVIAGNEYLAKRANRAGAAHVEIVPTVVDASSYQSAEGKRSDADLRLGWIGTPETWASLASGFARMIGQLATLEGVSVRLVGAEAKPRKEEPFEYLPWSEQTESELVCGMDIGLMPLPDTPWTRGKCGYKLIQYMACGLPVIASPVGVNREIVEPGVNGFLATTKEEWSKAITTLVRDPELRQRMGQAGRLKVEKQYSLQVQGPRVARLLKDVTEGCKP